jgi:two-component system NarL family response regulator
MRRVGNQGGQILRPIRIFLVHDHGLVLQAIRLALEACADTELVGDTDFELLPRFGDVQPDVVILDLGMQCAHGLRALDRVREQYPSSRIVLLSVPEDGGLAAEALGRGAAAVVGKAVDPSEVVPIVLRVADRPEAFDLFVGATVQAADAPAEAALTERERGILEQVAAGRSNREIASRLMLSERTIKYYLTRVYRKLGVAGRREAAELAHEHGLQPGTFRRAR